MFFLASVILVFVEISIPTGNKKYQNQCQNNSVQNLSENEKEKK